MKWKRDARRFGWTTDTEIRLHTSDAYLTDIMTQVITLIIWDEP